MKTVFHKSGGRQMHVCRLGREHGIPTPCNDLMLQLVLAKQSIYLGR